MMTPVSNGTDVEDHRVLQESGTSNAMMAMEMESLHPGATTVRKAQSPPPALSQLWLLIKMYIESYPKIFSIVGLFALGFIMYMAVEVSKPALSRNSVTHDYSKITMDYNFKAQQIDHWCLFGGDNACPRCDDFTEPVPREEHSGWLAAHEANKERLELDFDYDVVFLGDDLVEEMNGNWYNVERPDGQGKGIAKDFNDTFGEDGEVHGVALGIYGDSAPNLLWRITHGEMPAELYSKVWWISIGSNDMARGGCSEEATVLGILRVAEEVAFHNPGSVVVIQGILPRSSNRDGSLMPKPGGGRIPIFGKKHSEEYYAQQARNNLQLWPSIQAVNKELEDFCKEHDHIVYFDASNLFLGTMSNSMYRSQYQQIVTELMPDYVHLSQKGHDVLTQAIVDEIQNIVLDEDEENDVEPGN